MLTEIKNPGVEDVLIEVCDGLNGLPGAITTVWYRTIVQRCAVPLIRGSFRYAVRQHRDAIVKALKPVYTAPTEAPLATGSLSSRPSGAAATPAIVRLWESSWAEFVSFLEFDGEIGKSDLHHG